MSQHTCINPCEVKCNCITPYVNYNATAQPLHCSSLSIYCSFWYKFTRFTPSCVKHFQVESSVDSREYPCPNTSVLNILTPLRLFTSKIPNAQPAQILTIPSFSLNCCFLLKTNFQRLRRKKDWIALLIVCSVCRMPCYFVYRLDSLFL